MREVKFKAFIKETKELIDVVTVDFEAEEISYWVKTDNPLSSKEAGLDFEEIELMQFTGLKDKRGKEIYQDDIVKDGFGRILQVVWRRHRWEFKALAKTNFEYAEVYSWTFPEVDFEYLGNIHENPELLED